MPVGRWRKSPCMPALPEGRTLLAPSTGAASAGAMSTSREVTVWCDGGDCQETARPRSLPRTSVDPGRHAIPVTPTMIRLSKSAGFTIRLSVRSATNNPFEPGSDRVPQVWAGRHDRLADWRDRVRPRRAGGQYERGRTLLGEPGIGKSVLVRRLAADATQAGDWVTPQIRVPRGVNPLPLLAEHLLDLADLAGLPTRREKKLGALLNRVREVSVAGTGLVVDPPGGLPPHVALTRLLIEIGKAAAEAGQVALVHLDEVQNITDDDAMSQALVVLGDALAYEHPQTVPGGSVEVALPLVVYLTALPEFADQASTRIGATFARRFQTVLLDPISDDDLTSALWPLVYEGRPIDAGQTVVTMSPEAASEIVRLCHGDPFSFQLAGQHAWDAGREPRIEVADVTAGWRQARGEARRHVERQLERLPELERAMVEAMASLPPDERSLTRIAVEMGYEKAAQVGPTAQRLDTVRGMISRGRCYTFRARAVEAYLGGDWP
jgi:hypothetical protein